MLQEYFETLPTEDQMMFTDEECFPVSMMRTFVVSATP